MCAPKEYQTPLSCIERSITSVSFEDYFTMFNKICWLIFCIMINGITLLFFLLESVQRSSSWQHKTSWLLCQNHWHTSISAPTTHQAAGNDRSCIPWCHTHQVWTLSWVCNQKKCKFKELICIYLLYNQRDWFWFWQKLFSKADSAFEKGFCQDWNIRPSNYIALTCFLSGFLIS